jgi:hypothetical protein
MHSYRSLASGMVQIVDLASDAFHCASRNMAAIRLQTNVMFGTSGHVSAISPHPLQIKH